MASEILKHTLLGRYVPFGVFRIFNDLSLDRALEAFFQMIWLVPENDLLVSHWIPSLARLINFVELHETVGVILQLPMRT